MSVKSTKELTRKEAEDYYVELRKKDMERIFKSEAVLRTDKELEDVLERLNDKIYDGEGFEDYLII